MTFTEIINKIGEIGFTKSSIEKRCGFVSGKMTELSKGRTQVKPEIIKSLIFALEEIIEELNNLLEELRALKVGDIGQYCVYEFTFPDGKLYYGSTINIDSRWKDGSGYKNQKVGKAIEEFGWENIEKRIIAKNLTKENALLIERTLIQATNSNIPFLGYNIY